MEEYDDESLEEDGLKVDEDEDETELPQDFGTVDQDVDQNMFPSAPADDSDEI